MVLEDIAGRVSRAQFHMLGLPGVPLGVSPAPSIEHWLGGWVQGGCALLLWTPQALPPTPAGNIRTPPSRSIVFYRTCLLISPTNLCTHVTILPVCLHVLTFVLSVWNWFACYVLLMFFYLLFVSVLIYFILIQRTVYLSLSEMFIWRFCCNTRNRNALWYLNKMNRL